MSRVKSPQQKKQNSYKHDRVEGGEYPHADRRNRPRAKAVGQRQLRRTAKQILAIEPEDVVQLPTHTKIGWVKSSIRLSNHIKASAEGRIVREAHNLFRRGYNKKTHAQFARVLSSWIADSSSSYSARLADFYAGVLGRFHDELHRPRYGPWLAKRRDFLDKFFRAEPELRQRFTNWIARRKTGLGWPVH